MKAIKKHERPYLSESYVHTEGDALCYMVECTLATVERLAMLKSRSKYEYERQISIAQRGLDWLIEMEIPMTGRCYEIATKFEGSVKKHLEQYDVKGK